MSLHDIVIAGVTASAPSDGFIDPKTVYAYTNANPAHAPSTLVLSRAKARANRRHKNVISAILFYSNMKVISTTVGGSPTSDVAPTSITYRVEISSPFTTPDESNPGEFLTGDAAIERVIARALVKAETVNLEILDPTTSATAGNATTWARTGPRFESTVVGALYGSLSAAEAGVTILTV
jgi:hypothetical protein